MTQGVRGDRAAFALHLADLARPLARAHFRTPLAVEAKADASPVTQADRGIEALLRAEIRRAYPCDAILGEEEGGAFGQDLTWVIDPIDGTKSFVAGLPLFGTLIGLAEAGHPRLGVIDMPILGERWHGAGGRAWFGKAPVRTSGRRLAEARLFVGAPDRFAAAEARAVEALGRRVGFCRYGGDCYAYGLLASGHCDLVVEAGLQVYDVYALAPVVEGAGGVITDWQGRRLGPDFDGRLLAAASPALHAAALDALGG